MFYDSEIVDAVNFEVRSKIIDFVLKKCDRVQLLSEAQILCHIENPEELKDTSLECFIDAFVKCEVGESWGMKGLVFEFNLTQNVKDYFKQRMDLTSQCFLDKTTHRCLDNPTFYSGKDVLLTTCSHEGYIDIEKEFKKDLEGLYIKSIKKSKIYQKVLKKQEKLTKEQIAKWNKNYDILTDLFNYIQEEKNAFVYLSPKNPCLFKEYKQIAREYLLDDVFELMANKKFYSELEDKNIQDKIFESAYFLNLIIGKKI